MFLSETQKIIVFSPSIFYFHEALLINSSTYFIFLSLLHLILFFHKIKN
jgi:hypothetical protein